MVKTICASATRSRRASLPLPDGSFLILKRWFDLRENFPSNTCPLRQFPRPRGRLRPLPPVKHEAGDEEHRADGQRVRKCFRGRLLGGFLHAVLPDEWARLIVARERLRRSDLYSEHPTTSIRFDESPLSEYRQPQTRIVIRRQFDSAVATPSR